MSSFKIKRMLRRVGHEITVLNASHGGARVTPDHQSDGTILGTVEAQNRPTIVTESDGTELEADFEIRTYPEDVESEEMVELIQLGDGTPSLLKSSLTGHRYRLLQVHTEPSGLHKLDVVID